jgi:hypothetical protein
MVILLNESGEIIKRRKFRRARGAGSWNAGNFCMVG